MIWVSILVVFSLSANRNEINLRITAPNKCTMYKFDIKLFKLRTPLEGGLHVFTGVPPNGNLVALTINFCSGFFTDLDELILPRLWEFLVLRSIEL